MEPMDWDVIVPDAFANSHITNTATEAGATARHAASYNKTSMQNSPQFICSTQLQSKPQERGTALESN